MKNNFKLLVITPTLSDYALAGSFRLIQILSYFLDKQFFITVYTSDLNVSNVLCQEKYRDFIKITIIENKNQKIIFNKVTNRLFGIPDSLMFWCNKVKKEIIKNQANDDFDAIFTSSPPHSLQVVGMQISKRLQIPHFTDFRDDWMGSHRLWHLTQLHRYLSQQAEKSVLENSTLITHAIPFVAEEWKEKYQKLADKIFSLTNGYPSDILEYKDNNRTIKYQKNTIVYFGGNYNGFVVEKFIELRDELIRLELSKNWMIVTGGPFDIPYHNDEVWIHYGHVPQNQVHDYIYNANVHISLLPPGDLFPSRTIPLKLYTQVTTCGACVFIGNEGATTELFKDIDGVYFFGNNGWSKLAEWIKENQTKLQTRTFNRTNINRFNYDNICKKLLEYMCEKLD